MPNFLETNLSKADILRFFAFQIGRRRHRLVLVHVRMQPIPCSRGVSQSQRRSETRLWVICSICVRTLVKFGRLVSEICGV